jgi:murein L,D-transpeptidase YafK
MIPRWLCGAWLLAIAFVISPVLAQEAQKSPEILLLTVDKSKLQAELRTLPYDIKKTEILHTFRIAIGKEQGDKQKQGDNRTPEGVYITQNVIDGKSLPAKYGPFAIPLNYPNPLDVHDGKTGSGIWLHGVIEDKRVEEANVTEGCVAFYNADIIQLTKWLHPNQGLVVIANDLNQVNQPQDVNTIKAATEVWMSDWANKNVDGYIEHYSKNFSNQGKNRAQYRDYKRSVFASYKKMDVKLTKLRIISHPKYAVSMMEQDFNGDDRFISNGRKILYWTYDDEDGWKIRREIFEDHRLELVDYATMMQEPKTRSAQNLPSASESKPKL